MRLVATGQQNRRDYLFIADGTITTGGTAQLVLAQSQSRSYLLVQNLSNSPMWVGIGTASATCTISSGVVNAVTIVNAGFGFGKAPLVRFLGGGNAGNGSYLGLNQPGGASPSHPAQGLAVLSGGAVASVTIIDGGAGYVKAPYVQIMNSDLDPYGAFVPSANVGILLNGQGDKLEYNGTCCPTDPVSIISATTGDPFTCRFMD